MSCLTLISGTSICPLATKFRQAPLNEAWHSGTTVNWASLIRGLHNSNSCSCKICNFFERLITEKRSNSERSFIFWFSSQAAKAALPKPIWSQEPETSSASHTWIQEAKVRAILSCFKGHNQGFRWQVEHPGLDLAPCGMPTLLAEANLLSHHSTPWVDWFWIYLLIRLTLRV